MSYFELKDNDVFVNTIEANPDQCFYIYSGSIYLNNHQAVSGTYSDNILGVPEGYISLFEYNVNRATDNRIHPFITKGGQKQRFKSTSVTDWNTQFGYDGEVIAGNYNLSASISKFYLTSSTQPEFKYLRALKSSFNHYSFWSQSFDFANFENPTVSEAIAVLDIPSVFYGSSLKKGEVVLNSYISGTIAATLTDQRRNGELVQTYGPSTGSIEGVVLYDEGIIILTGSSVFGELGGEPGGIADATGQPPPQMRWPLFGWGIASNEDISVDPNLVSASYDLAFQGVSRVQNMTVLAKAPEGMLNHSNNPTYLEKSENPFVHYHTSSYEFIEKRRKVKNVVPSEQTDAEPPFDKETYISKICLYDEHRRLVGVCKLATPIRKTEAKEYLFKMKIDL